MNRCIKIFALVLLSGTSIFWVAQLRHADAAPQSLTALHADANCPGQAEVFYYDSIGNGNITCVAGGQSGYFQNIQQIINQSSKTASFTAAVSPPPPPVNIAPGQSMSFQYEMASGRSVNGSVTVP